ncbi:MAG: hypothetical protein LAKADJCE_00219 [Candidatus Argoarchaeum ethanivorans]|uniref:Uncharacterized protein n=1 Tax=Candidatus Argoarchaeum ethanivorans TaxID=2608793 RepID=A0A811T4A6_9EURY|nr:MAG: hypothetical protein LAKADJCE_00219 [Candidatus Argoarchaeum ethanivorans]
MPDNLKRVVANFRYEDKEVEFLLRDCTVEFSSEIAKSLNFTAEHNRERKGPRKHKQ